MRYVSGNEKGGERAIRIGRLEETRMTKDWAEGKQGGRIDGLCECEFLGGLQLIESWS